MNVNKPAPPTTPIAQPLRYAISNSNLAHGQRQDNDSAMHRSANSAGQYFPSRSVIASGSPQFVPSSRDRTFSEYYSYNDDPETSECRRGFINTENENTESCLGQETRRTETMRRPPSPPHEQQRKRRDDSANTNHRRLSRGNESITGLTRTSMAHPRPLYSSAGQLCKDVGSDMPEETSGSEQDTSFQITSTPSSPDLASRPPVLDSQYTNNPTTRLGWAAAVDEHTAPRYRDEKSQRSEDECIYMPSAVQSFGFLVVIKEDSDSHFSVRVASQNSARFLGYTPQQLFRLDSFLDIFLDEQADTMLDHVDFLRGQNTDSATTGHEVFRVSVWSPATKRNTNLWCAMHVSPAQSALIICEFELEDDREYPLKVAEVPTPLALNDALHHDHLFEERDNSTAVKSKLLRTLRSTRRKQNEIDVMYNIDIMSQIQEQAAAAPTLEILMNTLVGIVKELTGFHRVMIYHFDHVFNAKIVAELADPDQTRDLYMGLQFPSINFSKQARDLYQINKVQLLYDRGLELACLACRTIEDREQPLDLTHSYLHVMPNVDINYLTNMGIRASMSISINVFGQLWGLIPCHAYGARGMRVAFPVRKLCRFIGDTASRNIERISYISRLQLRKPIDTMPTEQSPLRDAGFSSEDLLAFFNADFGMCTVDHNVRALGKIEQPLEALALLQYFRLQKRTAVMKIQDVIKELPDLDYPPGFSIIVGLLYVPLSATGESFMILVRKSEDKGIGWARDPYATTSEGTTHQLEPRKSVEVRGEMIICKSQEWSDEQVKMAAVIAFISSTMARTRRQNEEVLWPNSLTRLLLANTAHAVCTALDTILNHLDLTVESAIDQDTLQNLSKTYLASESLIYAIDDLLDLAQSEEQQGHAVNVRLDISS